MASDRLYRDMFRLTFQLLKMTKVCSQVFITEPCRVKLPIITIDTLKLLVLCNVSIWQFG